MGRQLGIALGVAAVVVVVGAGTHIADFHGAWWFMVATTLTAGGLLLGLGRPATTVPEPVPVPA